MGKKLRLSTGWVRMTFSAAGAALVSVSESASAVMTGRIRIHLRHMRVLLFTKRKTDSGDVRTPGKQNGLPVFFGVIARGVRVRNSG